MKRIITPGVLGLAVAVFFTGCSSLTGSMEVDQKEIRSSAADQEVTDENGENLIETRGEPETMPDYFHQSMKEKFEGLGGKQAFQIKEGHSRETADIEEFLIGDLKNDRTFIYGYVTRVDDGGFPRKVVHCGAFYNYESQVFQVFHENAYVRTWEDENEQMAEDTGGDDESFFIQVCDSGDIFVYDNGKGYIYDSDGGLTFYGDIEAFVRRQFKNAYSVSVANVLTDGQRRIYMELTVEKEKVEVSEAENIGGMDEEDMEKLLNGDLEWLMKDGDDKEDQEAEKLDKEIEEKTETLILVYEYSKINSGMDQKNDAFEEQKSAWIAMTADREFDEPPDGTADWEQVVGEHPDSWGNAYLGGMEDINVYQWNSGEGFSSIDGITDFIPLPGLYRNFKDVAENQQLERLFIPVDGKYSDIYGKTKEFIYYDTQTIERNYTLVTIEESTDADGNTVTEEHSEVHTQTLTGVDLKRYAPLENAYRESYWILDKKKAVSLDGCMGSEILCTGEDGKVWWVEPGGKTFKSTSYKVEEDTQAGAFREDGMVYFVEYGKEAMSVVRDEAHGGGEGEKPDEILYQNLAGAYGSEGSVHDAVFEKKVEEDMPMGSVYGWDYYTEDQVLHAHLNLNLSLAVQLASKGDNTMARLAATGSFQGYLLTSQEKGLIFYAPFTKESQVLESGAWFKTWKRGDKYVSVGFLNGSSSYSGGDAAFARVYEYDLSELCNESMARAMEDITVKEQEELRKRIEEAGKETEKEEDDGETTKSLLDQWNQEYKEKYEQTYPEE